MVASAAAILNRLIEPNHADLAPEAARFLLRLNFKAEDVERMNELAEKAREGTLTAEEEAEIEEYDRIGNLLALMQSKARLSLREVRS